MTDLPTRQFSIALLCVAPFFSWRMQAEEITPAEHFEARIRPLLLEKCSDCHSGDASAESALPMNSRRALLAGGDFGAAILPGNSGESLLVQAVQWTHKELKMPPEEADRLSPLEIADLRRWIDDGAVWPGDQETVPEQAVSDGGGPKTITSDFWSFQPRAQPTPPPVNDPAWSETSIDRFVFARMADQGITPAELADRRTLIRRVNFDLLGLPPTPAEIDTFLNDSSSDAYTRLIDRLLDSPHYGERWGRHWLDVARYADTQGDVGDFPIPQAYLYRNWVIDALNADLPYDRFIQAQLAGDLLAEQASDEGEARGLVIATGFVALSRRFGNTKHEDQHLTIEDTIDTISRGLLGVTLRCARCHDHKFDPLLQSDYFGLYGMFQSTCYPTMGASNEKSPSALSPPIPNAETRKQIDAYFATIERYAYQMNNHFRPWLKPTLEEFKQVAAKLQQKDIPAEERSQLEARREELLGAFEGKFRDLMLHGLEWIRREKDRMAEHPPAEMVFAISEAEPIHAKMHLRGNPENLGPVVARHFPLVLSQDNEPDLQGSGRLELARWITSPDHPLTARVIVNRVWQHHFGRGIVSTVSNFGVQGTLPSHPELLDYLSNVFVEEDGWSLKALHRRILLSRAYRSSSDISQAMRDKDPDNIYLGRYARRRLEAEAIRDAMLAVSGQLDPSQGEGFPFPHWKQPQFSLNNPFKAEYPSNRRSVYLMTQRLFRQPFFALFDGPDRNQSTAERGTSTLPTQVLYLLNSPFVQEQATAFAQRVTQQAADDASALAMAYELAYGRLPTAAESQEVTQCLATLRAELGSSDTKRTAEERQRIWSGLAKAIFTSNEFLFVE